MGNVFSCILPKKEKVQRTKRSRKLQNLVLCNRGIGKSAKEKRMCRVDDKVSKQNALGGMNENEEIGERLRETKEEFRQGENQDSDLHKKADEGENEVKGGTTYCISEETRLASNEGQEPKEAVEVELSQSEANEESYADDEVSVPVEVMCKLQKAPSPQPTPRTGEAWSAGAPTHIRENIIPFYIVSSEPDEQTKELILTTLAKYPDADGDNDEDVVYTGQESNKKDNDDVSNPDSIRIYHYNAEDWSHFNAALEKEYIEQYGDGASFSSSMSRRSDDETSEREYSTPEIDNYDAYEDIDYILNALLERVEEIAAFRENVNKDDDNDSVATDDISVGRRTPPEIEGEIYAGPGILKKRPHDDTRDGPKRGITWDPNVKPPAADWHYLGEVCDDFLKERSKLTVQKYKEQRKRERLSKVSCRQVNNSKARLIAKGGRVPTAPITGRKPAITTKTQSVPDNGIVWPKRIEDVYTVRAKNYYLEQFQKTQLFKQKLKNKEEGNKTWKKGLTPFQIWVIEHAKTAKMDKDKTVTSTKPRTRPSTAKAKVSCWRGPTPAPK